MPIPISLVPQGADVFIDANIFYHALINRSADCLRFFKKCTSDFLHGYTASVVLWENIHNFMVAEVADNLKCSDEPYRDRDDLLRKAKAHLKDHKDEIPRLHRYWSNALCMLENPPASEHGSAGALPEDCVRSLGHCVCDDSQEVHVAAHLLRKKKREGLLTADSLILATAVRLRVGCMASTDHVFDGWEGIIRYAPIDVENAIWVENRSKNDVDVGIAGIKPYSMVVPSGSTCASPRLDAGLRTLTVATRDKHPISSSANVRFTADRPRARILVIGPDGKATWKPEEIIATPAQGGTAPAA